MLIAVAPLFSASPGHPQVLGLTAPTVGKRGGRSASYDDWTKKDLVARARELGIAGRSSMSKDELVKALRNH